MISARFMIERQNTNVHVKAAAVQVPKANLAL
jgi:hypothetical protein